MASVETTLSSAGCVKPWIQKFTNTPRDGFFDQFVDSHDARFVEIIEGPHESEIKYSEVPLDSNNPKSAPDLSKVFEQDGSKGILRLIILPFNTENDNAPPLSWKGFREHLDLLHLENTFICTEQMQTPPTWFEVPLQDGLKGFVVKPERWDSNLANFSISVVHSPASRVTHFVAHMLHKTDIKHLLLRLEALKALAWHPLLVPLILMEQRIEGTAEKLTLMRDSLYSVEKRTGTHKNYRNDKYHEELNHYAYGDRVWERRHEQDVDFEAAPGKITSIASDCAMTEAKCQCLNLMAQRDSALNLQKTEAALRDSSDMRAIAWVTLAFLPATFVAYFFLQL
ncbi:hypothetical protein FPRO04_03959 [Fusarium proliferatum]|nr:hypothetical protein FPRO03_06152 [Fusarium proliferatum]KAG4268870.1 hypothetical protein FPRO04_03959 [Fusarium proliferatum]